MGFLKLLVQSTIMLLLHCGAAGMRSVCPDLAISRKSGAFCPLFAPRFLQIARSAKTAKSGAFWVYAFFM